MFLRILTATLFLVLLNAQNLVFAMAYPDYEESIEIYVNISETSCSVTPIFEFVGAGGPFSPLEFENETGFVGLVATAERSRYGNYTEVRVDLDASKIANEARGKRIADTIRRRFEKLFGIYLPFNRSEGLEYFSYYYKIDFPWIEEFGDLLLRQGSRGFGELLTPSLLTENVRISFRLLDFGDGYEWLTTVVVLHQMDFSVAPGQEYTISLRETTEHSSPIKSAPEASSSILGIHIFVEPIGYILVPIETVPQMERSQQQSPRLFIFRYSDTNISVDDLSIRFRISSSGFIDPVTIVLAVVFLLTAALLVTELASRKKRRRWPFDRIIQASIHQRSGNS